MRAFSRQVGMGPHPSSVTVPSHAVPGRGKRQVISTDALNALCGAKIQSGGMKLAVNPDVILFNGNVITVDDANPRAEALAVRGEVLVAVGSNHQVRPLKGPRTREIDLQGFTVVPGFNDAHNHMLAFGLGLGDIHLKKPSINRVEDILEAVKARAQTQPKGTWIVGRGYDDNKLRERRHPTRWELDRVAPEHLVVLLHTSGHMLVANTAVLQQAGISASTPDPAGGKIVRDPASGEPTGLLQEAAQELVLNLRLPRTVDEIVDGLAAASEQYLREGITSAQEAGVGNTSPLELAGYQEAVRRGRLQVRVNLMIGVRQLQHLAGGKGEPARYALDLGLHSGFGGGMLRIGPVKIFADGSLIGKTAALSEGYSSDPDNTGFFVTEPELLREQILSAHAAGWQLAIHAIGDRAITYVLDCYEEALNAHPRKDHRHRIEHCGVLTMELIDRIARLRVIPVPQQRFISELGDGFIDNLGPSRARLTYPQRTFVDKGILFPGSSDRPVVEGAPLLGIHDAVNRITAGGRPYAPAERLTPEEALRCWTLHSAYCSFEEHIKGSLEPGKLADFVVLERDLTAVPAEEIAHIRVLATAVGGRFRYASGPFEGLAE